MNRLISGWFNTNKYICILLVLLSFACGVLCGPIVFAPYSDPDAVHATLEVDVITEELASALGRSFGESGKLELDSVDDVNRLLRFFPDYGTSDPSREKSAGWGAPIRVTILFSDKRRLVIYSDGTLWTEGFGDRKIDPGFNSVLKEIMTSPERAKAVQWTKPR